MKYFKKMIEQFIAVDDAKWAVLCSKLNTVTVTVTVNKGEMIHHCGDVFSDIYFVKSGLSRSYFSDVNGRDFTW